MMVTADDVFELDRLVREYRQEVKDVRADLDALRLELEGARVIAVPTRTTVARTLDPVPAGHRRGQCAECGGFHPVDGEPRERGQ